MYLTFCWSEDGHQDRCWKEARQCSRASGQGSLDVCLGKYQSGRTKFGPGRGMKDKEGIEAIIIWFYDYFLCVCLKVNF